MFPTIAIANHFIMRGFRDGVHVSPMKLQKLVYFAHGWYLALFNKPLIDERVEAWRFGPVIPSIYHRYKKFGNNSIDPRRTKVEEYPIDESTLEFLSFIWDLYKGFTAVELSNLTHVKKSPWDEMVEKNGRRIRFNQPIHDEAIQRYFKKEYLEQE
jgi:uncharacterized phage-associated protein